MGDPPQSGERSGGTITRFESTAAASQSFAELVAALTRLNALETALATATGRTQIPAAEVRQFLRASSASAAENAPAFQFLREVFSQVGIPISIEDISRFLLIFRVPESAHAQLFAAKESGAACAFVREALARFLAVDFGVPAEVDEVECRNEGAHRCQFVASLDPVAAAARALDADDWRLFRALAGNGDDPDLPPDERSFRMETLIAYGLVSADGRLQANGEALASVGPFKESTSEPPWRAMSRLTETIADAASAAEALVAVAPRTPPAEATPEAETAALAAECHSFAELLARTSKGRSWE